MAANLNAMMALFLLLLLFVTILNTAAYSYCIVPANSKDSDKKAIENAAYYLNLSIIIGWLAVVVFIIILVSIIYSKRGKTIGKMIGEIYQAQIGETKTSSKVILVVLVIISLAILTMVILTIMAISELNSVSNDAYDTNVASARTCSYISAIPSLLLMVISFVVCIVFYTNEMSPETKFIKAIQSGLDNFREDNSGDRIGNFRRIFEKAVEAYQPLPQLPLNSDEQDLENMPLPLNPNQQIEFDELQAQANREYLQQRYNALRPPQRI